MIKVDIVNEVSKIADITKVKAEVAVDAVFDAMRLSMQRGERIELRGFGVFQVKPRKRGIGRNPRTGKEVRMIQRQPGGPMTKLDPNGQYMVEQMYVQYFLPKHRRGKVPLLLWLGIGLLGGGAVLAAAGGAIVTEIIIGKNRNGPTGSVELVFRSDFMRFEPLDRWHQP